MAFNMAKAKALNKTAQGVSGVIALWQITLSGECAKQIPPKSKEWWKRKDDDPPPENILLPRKLLENLLIAMNDWQNDLLKHTEPFAK